MGPSGRERIKKLEQDNESPRRENELHRKSETIEKENKELRDGGEKFKQEVERTKEEVERLKQEFGTVRRARKSSARLIPILPPLRSPTVEIAHAIEQLFRDQQV